MGKKSRQKLRIQDGIQLLEVYYAEKNHRDSMYWKQMYYYYAIAFSMIIMPFFTDEAKNYNLPIPASVFEFVAIIFAFFTLYVSLAYVERDKKINNAINLVMEEYLPESCRIKRLEEGIFSNSIKIVVALVIFIVEILLAIILLAALYGSEGNILNCCCFVK